jgi:16S rRNA (uracil1498-N3)-methyltransferase
LSQKSRRIYGLSIKILVFPAGKGEGLMARYDFASTRLFVSHSLSGGAILGLERDPSNYLLNVLRMEEGAKLLVFNGVDGEWEAVLRLPSRKVAALEVQHQTREQDKPSHISYAFAPLKSARLDYLVQKAVEMGACRILPVLTQRTQVSRLKDERLRANAIEAAEQCGILNVAEIAPETKLVPWLRALPAEHLLIFCDEDADVTDPIIALKTYPRGTPATVLIGPEGGFDAQERALLLQHPTLCRLSLGGRILRADTAGVAALALVQAVIGDWC